MRGGTLFSGIGCAELAMPWVDWRWCAEIGRFPSTVLAQRFPSTPNLGDVTRVDWDHAEPVDLVVFGSPCQSFSVAGQRAGLDDPRGNLTLIGLAIVGRLRPRWVVWENVPGVLSIDGGRTFGAILGTLGQLGYGFAYRILDAQHFGVPQRRRRVFVVGCLGDWRSAAAVLFERASLSGNPQAGDEAGQDIAGSLGAGFKRSGGRVGRREAAAGQIVETTRSHPRPGSNSLGGGVPLQDASQQDAKGGGGTGIGEPGGPMFTLQAQTVHGVAHSLRADGFDASEDGTGRGTPLVAVPILESGKRTGASTTDTKAGDGIGHNGDPMFTLGADSRHAVAYRTSPNCGAWETGERTGALNTGTDRTSTVLAFDTTQITSPECRSNPQPGDPCHTLSSRAHPPAIASVGVRRLTPLECERLQGLPDGHTAITYRGKPAADGPRYKAIGNGMAAPCVAWIGDRIAALVRAQLGIAAEPRVGGA